MSAVHLGAKPYRGWRMRCQLLGFVGLVFSSGALAQQPSQPSQSSTIASPANYIQQHGFDSKAIGDDGKTEFYKKQVVISEADALRLASAIEKLDKHERVFEVCQFLSKGIKATLIEQRRIELDVALVNYGYRDSVIACTDKLIVGAQTGLMIVLYEVSDGKMYSLYFREEVVH